MKYKTITSIVIIISSLVFSSCQSHKEAVIEVDEFSPVAYDILAFSLSLEKPTNKDFNIKLNSISKNGTVSVTLNNQIYSGKDLLYNSQRQTSIIQVLDIIETKKVIFLTHIPDSSNITEQERSRLLRLYGK